MRLWPRSIASRTALVLIAGVLTLLWAGAMVWWLSVAQAEGPPGSRVAFESVASVAAMVDRLPPGARAAALKGATTDALKLVWSTTRPTRILRESSWEVRWAARQLKRSLAVRGLSTVDVGVPAARTRGAGRLVLADIQLKDGSWLTISSRDEMRGPPRPLVFLGVIAVLALGLTG
ncbi:MAG: hypothetical protein OEQ29_09125, partial [Alphaproteobacteria bacterium]|nr:hypothetical protein [Alphaproteobacteria bacterium]